MYKIIFKALEFASVKHKGQKRKDDFTPYINHPVKVAEILVQIGDVEDEQIIAAALLHDTIEDTETEPHELEEIFGKTITDYVLEVTDDKNISKRKRKEFQILNAKNLSKGAALIRVADKIANLKDIANNPPLNWNNKRKLKYFEWTKKVISNLNTDNEKLLDYYNEVYEENRKKIKD
jgi:GTP diphosphokinase / guanosine-3',5'-bis(diphosphate) 3'-diphosphatase